MIPKQQKYDLELSQLSFNEGEKSIILDETYVAKK
jgi:hypothetical protein